MKNYLLGLISLLAEAGKVWEQFFFSPTQHLSTESRAVQSDLLPELGQVCRLHLLEKQTKNTKKPPQA